VLDAKIDSAAQNKTTAIPIPPFSQCANPGRTGGVNLYGTDSAAVRRREIDQRDALNGTGMTNLAGTALSDDEVRKRRNSPKAACCRT